MAIFDMQHYKTITGQKAETAKATKLSLTSKYSPLHFSVK